MQSKISLKWPLLIVIIAGIIFSPIIIFLPTFYSRGQDYDANPVPLIESDAPQNSIDDELSSQSAVSSEQVIPGLPVLLKIPKIDVDTTLEHVGLTPDGAVDVPKDQNNAAWFMLGPRPGEKGSAIITGHYGWKNKKGSAFDNLYKLRKGDKLYVEDDKGAATIFVVRENRRYEPTADALAVFASNDDEPHLNLITCEGVWDKASQSYSERLVVFTDKEEEGINDQEDINQSE